MGFRPAAMTALFHEPKEVLNDLRPIVLYFASVVLEMESSFCSRAIR